MFLSGLPRQAKESYYKLAYCLMNADHKETEEELAAMKLYEYEMDIDVDFDFNNIIIEDEIIVLNELDSASKKQVYFELISLAVSDNDYAEDEMKIIDSVTKKLEISESDQIVMKECAEAILSAYHTLGRVFNNH